MLFEKVRKTAPAGFSVKAKASFNAMQWTKVVDDQFVEYVVNRYTSLSNANSNISPVEVYRGPDRKAHDVNADGGMAQDGDYWYAVLYVDFYGNESSFSSPATARFSGQKSSDLVGQVVDSQVTGLAASKLIGQLVANQIAAGILDASKFVSTIKPIEIFATRPVDSTATPAGRVIFVQADGKLYRATGAAWISSVSTTDLSGTLTDAQLAGLAASKITGQLSDSQLAAISAAKLVGQLSDAQLAAISAAKISGTLSDAQLAAISAAKVTGQIGSTQIADDAITTPKINSAAVTTNEIAATTIVAGNVASATITGTKVAATTIVAGNIATGTITAGQIASATITGTTIAGATITAGNIVTGTITAALIAASTITGALIAGGTIMGANIAGGTIQGSNIAGTTITGGNIVGGTITATQIAANTITGDRIVAGTITAALIAAGQITASKIAVGTFSDNLILDGDFESGLTDNWAANGTSGYAFSNVADTSATAGGRALLFDRGTAASGTAYLYAITKPYYPVEAGDTYYAEFTIKAPTATVAGAYLRMLFLDGNKAAINDPATGSAYHDFYANGAIPASYATFKGTYVIPAGVKYVQMEIYHYLTSTAQTMSVSNLMLKKSITGDLIVSGSITASHIASYNLTAANATIGNINLSNANIGTLTVGTINLANNAVTYGKTDATLPAALTTAPVGGQTTVDVDLDGRADIAVMWTWTKPTDTASPVIGYQVNIFENGTKIESKSTSDLVTIYKGKAGKAYYATVQTIGFNGKMSVLGAGTSNTVNTVKKAAISGNSSWSVAGFAVNQGISVALLKWTRCTQPDYLETHAFRYLTATDAANNTNATDIGSVNANWFTDSDPLLLVGSQYWYRIQHYDRSQNPGPLSGVLSVVIRGVSVKDMLTPDSTNLLQDPNMEDVSAWIVNNAGSAFGIVRELNSGANGYSKYRLHVQGNGVELRTPYIMVDPGETYYVECWAGTLGTAATISVFTNEFSYDATGAPVYTNVTTLTGSSSVSAMQLFTFTFTPSAPLIKLEFNTQGTSGVRDLYVASAIIRRINHARDYGDLTIPNAAYKNNSITVDKMAVNSVDSSALAPLAVGHSHLQDTSVDTNNLRANSITQTQMASNSVGASQLINGGVQTVHHASSACTAKYQVSTAGSITLTTSPQEIITDTVSYLGSDFEWLIVDLQCYVGANASALGITFEIRQGSTSLYSFQTIKPATTMVRLQRAFASGSLTSNATIHVFASVGSGTLNISDRQMLNMIYKR